MREMTAEDKARYEQAVAHLKHHSPKIRAFAKLVIRTLEAKYKEN